VTAGPSAELQPTPVAADVPPEEAGGASDAKRFDARVTMDGQAREIREAYRRGWQSLHTEGRTAFVDDSTVKNLHFGDRHYYTPRGQRPAGKNATPIRPTRLARIRSTYVRVGGYSDMLTTLREHRALLLRGRPGSGRSTTATHLLDEVATDRVYELDLLDGVGTIRKQDLKKGRGYVVRTPTHRPARRPTETQLDQLRDLLAERDCYCVMIDAEGHEARNGLERYVREHRPPERKALLRRHIRCGLGMAAASDTETRLLRLWDDRRMIDALGPAMWPADIVWLADLLVRLGQDETDVNIDTVVTACQRFVEDRVAEWFDEATMAPEGQDADIETRRTAFRISLAVLNTSPCDVVAEASEKLTKRLLGDRSGSDVVKESLFTDDRDTMLAAARAHIVDGPAAFGEESSPARLASFEDDRYPRAVLRHVWRLSRMRPVLIEWLRELGQDRRPMVWVRAAQVAGMLTALDVHYGFNKLVRPHARADSKRARRFAAVALDEAAQHHRVQHTVLSYLRYWRRHGNKAEQWTTAAALGYQLGLDSIDGRLDGLCVLDELLILGTPSELRKPLEYPTGDRAMLEVVSTSISQLLAAGAVEPVLTRLMAWLEHRRWSVRLLARWTVVRLAGMHGFDLDSHGRELPLVGRRYERWPLLLALQHIDATLASPVADLLRHGLRGPFADSVLVCLRQWISVAERDQDELAALVEFVPRLVTDRSDAARLNHLVTAMRRDWAEPLAPDVATAVEDAIRSAGYRESYSWASQNNS
jgi:hypothetical protein